MAGGLAVMTMAQAVPTGASVMEENDGDIMLGRRRLHIIDLTHVLTTAFNWMPKNPRIAMEPIVGSGQAVGMKLNRLSLVEHTGTHIDAPRHFSDTGKSLGEIPISDLVVPLAVIDLREKARIDPDVGLLPDDILAWERQHGKLPKGCCVAVNSGYEPISRMHELMKSGRLASPGISPDASDFLIDHRNVKGVAIDAMSIDQSHFGVSYPVHQQWLRSGRWGIEGLTNLNEVPAAGALIFVGAAPIKDATGLPIRTIAMFERK